MLNLKQIICTSFFYSKETLERIYQYGLKWRDGNRVCNTSNGDNDLSDCQEDTKKKEIFRRKDNVGKSD